MPNYIRAKFEGGYYFFTVVTYAKEGFYGRVDDFKNVKNISTEGFGE